MDLPPAGSIRAALLSLARRTGARALDLIYPGFCRECEEPIEGQRPFCARCEAGISWIRSACPRCGEAVARPGPEACGSCAGRELFFDRAAAAAEYTGPWRTAVLRFKYLGDHGLRGPLGAALLAVFREQLAGERPEALVPVPGHPWRRLVRGRDPVEELALELGQRTGLPVRQVLRRTRWIPSQTSLERARRLRNPAGAYAARFRYRARRGRRAAAMPRAVLLIDDVFTTGATASECARALKQAGAERVLVVVAARSPN